MKIELRKLAEDDAYDNFSVTYQLEAITYDDVLEHLRGFLQAAGFEFGESEYIEVVDYGKKE